MRNKFFILLLAWTFFAVGCNSSDGNDIGTKFHSDSYFPIDAISTSSSALPTELNWSYRLAGGNSITVPSSSGSVFAEFQEYKIVVDTNESTRKAVLNGAIVVTADDEDYPGSYRVELTEFYETNSTGETVQERINIFLDFTLTDDSGNVVFQSNMTLQPLEPVLVFFDRTDFSELIGFRFGQQIAGVHTTGTLTQTAKLTQTIDTIGASTNYLYEVVEILDVLQVQGAEYSDVVVIDYTYDAFDSLTNQTIQTTSRIYLARGIGMVKGENIHSFYGAPLSWELVQTNLEQ